VWVVGIWHHGGVAVVRPVAGCHCMVPCATARRVVVAEGAPDVFPVGNQQQTCVCM
jgi:hypothetical protein